MQAAAANRASEIPGRLNVALALAAMGGAAGLLVVASRMAFWPWGLVAAVLFSYFNNTIFSLLHESVHGIFHRNRRWNDAFGRLTAVFFPTSFCFQRICHLGHHRRNRSDAELFDYVRPGENRLLKYAQWYGILTGVYWMLSPVACILYLISPRLFGRIGGAGEDAAVLRQTGAEAMASGFRSAPRGLIRAEVLLTIALQLTLCFALGITLKAWLICYAAFAVNWSSLQYADHAWSNRHVHDGAWNLRASKIVQYIFLNYHHHKAHHQNPQVSWINLGNHVDPLEFRPSFLRIYLQMWLGPREAPADSSEMDNDAQSF